MRKTSLTIVTTIAMGTLALSACSSAGSPAVAESTGQTVEQACDVVYQGMANLEAELSEVAGTGTEEDLAAMVQAANVSLETLDQELVNTQVRDLWEPIATLQRNGLQAAADGDQEALMGAYLEMTEKYEAFAEVCPNVKHEGE